MRIGILTDFVSHDPAYSLCGVVLNQLHMLNLPSERPEITVFVRSDPNNFVDIYTGLVDHIVELDPGETGSNEVKITEDSEKEIDSLQQQMWVQFRGLDVVLTHDLIYQANMWKYHVAARRLANNPDVKLRWLHWVHSSTDWDVASQTGKFAAELDGPFPNARLVAFHPEEINRKGTTYGYERDQIATIPNPYHIEAYYHPIAQQLVHDLKLWETELLAIYPARLDRGKQIEVVGDIFRELVNARWDARVIVVDFHSTAGDKATYRNELKTKYGDFMTFTSDIEGLSYHVPHEAVLNLFEYADIFIHPSRNEADPLTIPEAEWHSNLLVLNFDLPLMRQWQETAIMGKFSSNIDVNTGMPGATETEYQPNRRAYMRMMAEAILYHAVTNPLMIQHRKVRNERSIQSVFYKSFWPVVSGAQ
jgi:glycosyltransferase involved in cell wall biosynthesis